MIAGASAAHENHGSEYCAPRTIILIRYDTPPKIKLCIIVNNATAVDPIAAKHQIRNLSLRLLLRAASTCDSQPGIETYARLGLRRGSFDAGELDLTAPRGR